MPVAVLVCMPTATEPYTRRPPRSKPRLLRAACGIVHIQKIIHLQLVFKLIPPGTFLGLPPAPSTAAPSPAATSTSASPTPPAAPSTTPARRSRMQTLCCLLCPHCHPAQLLHRLCARRGGATVAHCGGQAVLGLQPLPRVAAHWNGVQPHVRCAVGVGLLGRGQGAREAVCAGIGRAGRSINAHRLDCTGVVWNILLRHQRHSSLQLLLSGVLGINGCGSSVNQHIPC